MKRVDQWRKRWRARPVEPDARALRRVGWRLAWLTVALTSVLLLVLGAFIYVLTQQSQQQALEATLRRSTRHPPAVVRGMISYGSAFSISHGSQFGPPPSPSLSDVDSNGVFYTVLDTKVTVLGEIGPFSPPLVDAAGAKSVLQTGVAVCCNHVTNKGQDYLVYSVPVVSADGSQLLGVLQSSISEAQYQNGLRALLKGLALVSALGLLAAGGISSVLARRALSPIRVSLRRQRDFVADAAHELRTPLAISRTSAELGLAAGTIPELQAALEQSLMQATHLTRLVDTLSLLARADSGVLQLEKQCIDLAELVRSTAESMEVLAEDRLVRLWVEAESTFPVLGDADRLRQLLVILLDNALKYTPDGGSIRIALQQHGNRIQLSVQDSGPGIRATDLPHLFDRFYRADQARSSQGMGLGLAIGRWIAEVHGGRIGAINAPEGGALFTVTLPAA